MIKLRKRLFIGLLSIILILPAQVFASDYNRAGVVATNAEPGNGENPGENNNANENPGDNNAEEVSIVEEFEDIPFDTETIESDEIYEGSSKIDRYGVNGLQKVRYEVVKKNGTEISRTRIGSPEIVTEPVSQIVLVGTKTKEAEEANTLLESVEIVGAKLNEEFDPQVNEYSLTLEEGVDRISFFAKAQDPNSKVEGLESVYISDKLSHSIKVEGIDGTSNIYKFTWKAPEAVVFKYRDDKGELVDLSYDSNKQLSLDGLNKETISIKGQKFQVYKDGEGNVLIGLTGPNSKYSSWYLYKDENNLKKLGDLISIDSKIYEIVEQKTLAPEILDKYNLSTSIVEHLVISAFKLNKKELDGRYIFALKDLSGQQIWFVFDDKTKSLEEFSREENLDESSLDKLFSKYLGNDWNKAGEININLSLIVIVILAIILILTVVLIVLLIKSGKDREEIEEEDKRLEDFEENQNPDNLFEVDEELTDEEVAGESLQDKPFNFEETDRFDKTEVIKKIDDKDIK